MKDITKYLIKITLKEGKGVSNLQFKSSADYFIGFSGSGNGTVTTPTNLSMSSVIQFGYISGAAPTIGTEGGYANAKVVLNSTPTYSHFEYTNNSTEYYGAITANTQSIASGLTPADANTALVLYILVDYNLDALNAFYSYNLQSSWAVPPQFTNKDFMIFILG